MHLRRRLAYIRNLQHHYANWPELLLARLTSHVPTQFILRPNIRFEANVRGDAFPWQFLIKEIFEERIYLPPELSIGLSDIIIDIGAHVGIFTLFAASLTRGDIYAYEPDPNNYAQLLHLLAINGANQVIPQRMAVADTSGETPLLLSPISSTRHALDLPDLQVVYQAHAPRLALGDTRGEAHAQHRVRTTTLSEIICKHDLSHVDFLKMDCEGAEGLILRATSREDLRKIRQIALEYHDHMSPLSHEQLRTLLEAAGFTTRIKAREGSLAGYLYAWQSTSSHYAKQA